MSYASKGNTVGPQPHSTMRFAGLLLLILMATAAVAQSASPDASPALPTDPAPLLQLAFESNGLHGSDLKPWHIRASWHILDVKRKVQEEGTWEEWWAGEKKHKVTVQSGDSITTSYSTDRGRFLTKTSDRIPATFTQVEHLITRPVPDQQLLALTKSTYSLEKQKDGLECVIQHAVGEDGKPLLTLDAFGNQRAQETRFCFRGGLPAIRSINLIGGQTVFNSLIRFQGQYLAQKIASLDAIGRETDINLDIVEAIDPVVEADFVPPPDAKLLPDVRKVSLASGVTQGMRISGEVPAYPIEARMNRIQGTVVIETTIGTDGRISDLRVIAGPQALQQAALQAVRTWRYRPYLLGGEPVSVETQINVVFQLGR